MAPKRVPSRTREGKAVPPGTARREATVRLNRVNQGLLAVDLKLKPVLGRAKLSNHPDGQKPVLAQLVEDLRGRPLRRGRETVKGF